MFSGNAGGACVVQQECWSYQGQHEQSKKEGADVSRLDPVLHNISNGTKMPTLTWVTLLSKHIAVNGSGRHVISAQMAIGTAG